MPKLPKDLAAQVDAEEYKEPSDGYQPWPKGRYVCKLVDVEEGAGAASGIPYWKVQLAPDKDYHPDVTGRQFDVVSHSPKAKFKMKQFFTGFGYSADSDTDEILDDPDARTILVVGLKPKQVKVGDKYVNDPSGEQQNTVLGYVPFDPDNLSGLAGQDEDTF